MTDTRRSWTLVHRQRCWSLNDERNRHWRSRHLRVAQWREAFGWLAQEQRIPALTAARITAQPGYRTHVADTGNAYPAIKAAIDGLIDVGVLPDDSGAYVLAITMLAPTKGEDRLLLRVDAAEGT